MTQQRKIWESFTLKWVNRVALWRKNRKPEVRNGQWKGREIPKGHFMVCVNVASEITLNLFFFFVKHFQCPRGKPATSLQRSCSTVKKESSSFYRGWRHCWQLGIYYFCFAKLFKGQTMIMLNGICVTKDCECMFFLDHFVLTVQLQKHSVKWEKIVHV